MGGGKPQAQEENNVYNLEQLDNNQRNSDAQQQKQYHGAYNYNSNQNNNNNNADGGQLTDS